MGNSFEGAACRSQRTGPMRLEAEAINTMAGMVFPNLEPPVFAERATPTLAEIKCTG